VFSILQLPIPHGRNGKVPIDKCIQALLNEEILEKDDAWCAICCRFFKHEAISPNPVAQPFFLLQGLPKMQDQTTNIQKIVTSEITPGASHPSQALRSQRSFLG